MSTDKCLTNLTRHNWLTDGPLKSIVTPYIESLRKLHFTNSVWCRCIQA